MCTKICRRSAPEFHQKQSKRPKFSGATSTTVYFLISAKTSLFFSFYEGSWSFMLSLSIIYACFYACSLEFFVLSIIIVSPKEHPGLGAASARRHRAFLRARGRDGGGERRRLWRVDLSA